MLPLSKYSLVDREVGADERLVKGFRGMDFIADGDGQISLTMDLFHGAQKKEVLKQPFTRRRLPDCHTQAQDRGLTAEI